MTDTWSASRTVVRRIVNRLGNCLEYRDRERHYFDIDELYVHVALPAGTLSLTLFRPSAPGIHIFHCHVLGH
jgi:hypothetical protein